MVIGLPVRTYQVLSQRQKWTIPTKISSSSFFLFSSDIRLQQPARPNGIFVSDANVRQHGYSYDIALTSAKCGYGYPLLGIHNADLTVDESDKAVYANVSAWPADVRNFCFASREGDTTNRRGHLISVCTAVWSKVSRCFFFYQELLNSWFIENPWSRVTS